MYNFNIDDYKPIKTHKFYVKYEIIAPTKYRNNLYYHFSCLKLNEKDVCSILSKAWNVDIDHIRLSEICEEENANNV